MAIEAETLRDALEEFQKIDGYHKQDIVDLLTDFGTFLLARPDLIHRSALAEDTARAAEGMLNRAEKAETGLAEAIAAIEFCEAIDDHYEAREFLWPEFAAAPALPLDKEAADANR